MNSLLKLILTIAIVSTGALCELKGEFEQSHMHDTHQIEVTDEVTFFKLHDENGDGFWDENELKSMYGVERDIDPNSSHIKLIIDRIYDTMDVNKDRFISMDEYITSKLPTLSKKQEEAEVELKKAKIQRNRTITAKINKR